MSPGLPPHRVTFSSAGRADFNSLSPDPKGKAKRIWSALADGKEVPRIKQLELESRSDMYRVAFGDWRLIYRLDGPNRHIEITRIRRRAVAYIGLERPSRQ